MISDNANKKWDTAAADGYALASVITNFEFIMTLVIVTNDIGYTKTATVQLQGEKLQIMESLKQVNIMMNPFNAARDLIDGYHDVWFNDALCVADQVDASVKSPQICGKQRHRGNFSSEYVSSSHKLNVSIPFLGHFL